MSLLRRLAKHVIPRRAVESVRQLRKRLLAQTGRALSCVHGTSPRRARIFACPDAQVFFGYYDVTPFSPDGRKLLALHAPPDNISPHSAHPPVKIGFYDLGDAHPSFRAFSESTAWNWQQGCRLQWFPDGTGRHATHNVFEDGQYRSVVRNVETAEVKSRIGFPIYALAPDGRSALTLDFSRLHRMRPGYGYSNRPDPAPGQDCPEDDGVFLGDTATGRTDLVLSLAHAATLEPHDSMEGARHYFNHLAFSPSGRRWMVAHLWQDARHRRHSRIIVCSGSHDFQCLNSRGFTSHYTWAGDDALIVFGSQGGEAPGYDRHDLTTGEKRRLADTLLCEDGHPTLLNDGRLLTDTYPNALRFQKVMLYNPRTGGLAIPARFYVPPSFSGEMRCDLHPRLGPAQREACVDMVFHGKRAICVFPL